MTTNTIHKNSLSVEEIRSRKYGKLTVIQEAERQFPNENSWRKYLRFFQCKCDCGNEVIVNLNYLRATGGKTSCGCLQRRTGEESPLWKGFGKISGSVIKIIRGSAKLRSLDFDLDAQFLNELFNTQGGKCALSGIDLILPSSKRKKNVWTASVDRIDSSKGYTKDNVQWVHKKLNMMKQDLSEQEFINFCKQVISYQGSKHC